MKYNVSHYINVHFDNILINNGKYNTKVDKPVYSIDFYLDDTLNKKISNYQSNAKTKFAFPIMSGEHTAKWVFNKLDNNTPLDTDASYLDNVIIREAKPNGVKMVEEFIECGGHRALKLLIDNLLEYYKRHHSGCKGRRDIWIYE